MLHGAVCPLTAAVSAVAIASCAALVARRRHRPDATLFAATTAMLVSAQAVNVPILPGVSGHLVGGVLAARVLGAPAAVLSMSLVLVFQAFALGDGGVHALGSNLLNLAVVAPLLGGLLDRMLRDRTGLGPAASAALASWLSVVAASVVLGVELSLGGTASVSTILPALIGVHLVVGIGEGLLTTALLHASTFVPRARPALPWAALALGLLALSTVSSPLPDGLEWALRQQASID